MRRNDRSFRPTDPQLAAPVWVWGLVVVLVGGLGAAAAIYLLLT